MRMGYSSLNFIEKSFAYSEMTEPAKLDRIQLKGFKSIQEMDFAVGDINLLIGPNGAGKSNFMSFFRFANKLRQKDLQLFVAQQGGAEGFLHFGRKRTDAIDLQLHFGARRYRAKLVPALTDKLIFDREYCELSHGNGPIDRVKLANAGDPESGLPDLPASEGLAGAIARGLDEWKVHHFHDTSESARIKRSCDLHDNQRLKPHGENLAAFLHGIQETDLASYRRIVATIQRVAPFFQDFVLIPEKADPDRIRLRWKHRGTEDYFDANAFSDGTLRFICLSALLLQPRLPSVILLDEPELGLHPFAMQLLAGMMRAMAHQSQIIASTQSVTLANQFSCEDLIVVEHQGDISRFRRLEKARLHHWLDAYRLGDLWEKNLIGGTPSC